MHPATAKLYEVFKPCRLGNDFTGCEHCVTTEDSVTLASKPMRELSVADLKRFAFKTMSTWGTVRHFKHFLPRMFELLLDNFTDFDFPEVLIRKLNYAKWHDWPGNEREAICEFLQYLWGYHLAIPPEYDGDDRVQFILDATFEVTNSFSPYLELFLSQNTASSAHHLREIVTYLADDIMTDNRGSLSLSRFDVFVDWLVSDSVIDYLRQYESEMVAETPWLFDQLDGVKAAWASREQSAR